MASIYRQETKLHLYPNYIQSKDLTILKKLNLGKYIQVYYVLFQKNTLT